MSKTFLEFFEALQKRQNGDFAKNITADASAAALEAVSNAPTAPRMRPVTSQTLDHKTKEPTESCGTVIRASDRHGKIRLELNKNPPIFVQLLQEMLLLLMMNRKIPRISLFTTLQPHNNTKRKTFPFHGQKFAKHPTT